MPPPPADDRRPTTSDRLVPLAFLALGLLVHPVFPHFQSPNELSRWVEVAAVVEQRSLDVTPLLPFLEGGFADLSVKDGRTYSNKAPGLALVAMPAYVAARPFTGPPSAGAMRAQVSAMRLLGSTLPAVALALLVAWAARRLGAEPGRVPLVAASLLFATPLFAYGLLLFSHALVACSLFAAFACLFVSGATERERRREVAAGVLLGLAVISEYTAAVPAAVLVVIAAWRRPPSRLLRILAGGAPFALLLGAYDTACFGGPLALSSGFERSPEVRALAANGLFGIGWPSPGILARLLLDPGKGLLVFSPFLVLAPAAFRAAAHVLPRRTALALVLTPLSILLLHAGYPSWHGGWSVGPRYLVPALPFLVFPFAFRERRPLDDLLLGASLAAVVPTSLVFPFVPPGFPVPWLSLAAPLLRHGLVAPNVLHLVARPLAVAGPFLVVAAPFAALQRGRALARTAVGAALGMAAGAVVLSGSGPDLDARIQRAYIEEAYFEGEGALERDLPGVLAAFPHLEAWLRSGRQLGPTGWPF